MSIREIKDMSDWEIEQWSSFKYYFDRLWPVIGKQRKIVELGCGLFSTEYLSDHCDQLISYEHDDDWRKLMEPRVGKNTSLRKLDTLDLQQELPTTDILFVDGIDRHLMVHMGATFMVPIIMIHDFDIHDKDKIGKVEGYYHHDGYGLHFNPTGLYTLREELIYLIK